MQGLRAGLVFAFVSVIVVVVMFYIYTLEHT